jgi:hypothetical protein
VRGRKIKGSSTILGSVVYTNGWLLKPWGSLYEPARLEVEKAVTATETERSGIDAARWAEKVVRGFGVAGGQ